MLKVKTDYEYHFFLNYLKLIFLIINYLSLKILITKKCTTYTNINRKRTKNCKDSWNKNEINSWNCFLLYTNCTYI